MLQLLSLELNKDHIFILVYDLLPTRNASLVLSVQEAAHVTALETSLYLFLLIVSVMTLSWTQKFANLPDFIFGAILPAVTHTSMCVCLCESNQIRRKLRKW